MELNRVHQSDPDNFIYFDCDFSERRQIKPKDPYEDIWDAQPDCVLEATIAKLLEKNFISLIALEARADGASMETVVQYQTSYKRIGRANVVDLIYSGVLYRCHKSRIFKRKL